MNRSGREVRDGVAAPPAVSVLAAMYKQHDAKRDMLAMSAIRLCAAR